MFLEPAHTEPTLVNLIIKKTREILNDPIDRSIARDSIDLNLYYIRFLGVLTDSEKQELTKRFIEMGWRIDRINAYQGKGFYDDGTGRMLHDCCPHILIEFHILHNVHQETNSEDGPEARDSC